MAKVDMGFRHYERRSAQRIVDLITTKMWKHLINGIENNPAPVSIITDGVTDNTQNQYLVVLPHIIEDNQPKVVFYKLLEITEGESADDLKDLLVKAFVRDHIEHYMKIWLTGYGADRAAVMMGEEGGLGKKLEQWTERRLVQVHCLATESTLSTGDRLTKMML